MPRGASPKREREYEELVGKFKSSGRYEGREEEVASRIVNKQRREYGETKKAEQRRKRGEAPDQRSKLPISHYREMTVSDIKSRLGRLSGSQLRQVKSYEQNHKARKSLLQAIDKRLH